MIDTISLRRKILERALLGELTTTITYEESVEDLKRRIAENRDLWVKQGDAKKEKKTPEIDSADIPFNIPSDWCWTRIGHLFQHNTGKALNSSNTEGEYFEYITTSNLYWDRFELDELKSMLFKETELKKCTVRKGDLLVCEGGDIGRAAIWKSDEEIMIQNHIHRLRPYCNLCVRFYYYIFWYYKQIGRINGKGIGLQGLSTNTLYNLIVPLPPIDIQWHISNLMDEAFSLLDTIDELQSAYSSDLEVLKSKIIDAGIQGKLTEQLQEDGNAEDLYAVIQEEKERLIKEKKIKKSKALPEITEDEMPFEISDNWKWVRLVDLCKQVTDGTHKTPNYTEKGIPFLSVKDISSGFMNFSGTKFISTEEHEQLVKRCKPEKSDILFCRIGTLGKAIEIDTDIQFSIFVSLGLIKPIETRITRYLVYVLNSGYGYEWIKQHKAGDSMHAAKINLDMLRTFPVPIPPIKEMERIVDKVNMLLDMI